MTRKLLPFLSLLLLALGLSSGTSSNIYTEDKGFDAQDYQGRCQKLLDQASDGIILIGNAGSPDLAYLTGVRDRDAKLILIPPALARKAAPSAPGETTLFLQARSPRWGVWEDPELSPGEEAAKATGIARTADIKEFYSALVKLGPMADSIYICQRLAGGAASDLDQDVVETVKRVLPGATIKNLSPILEDLRWSKSPREVEIMKKACRITAEGFKEAARTTKPGVYEYELEGLISYIFRKNGSSGPAFLIIGSGPNSCILHHMSNDRRMESGELVVLDIGTDFHSFSTDLTRTLPVSGKFSPEQRKIYGLVLEAQKKALAVVKPGATLADVHKAAFDYIDQAGYGKYFIHGTSHSLNGGSGYMQGEPPPTPRVRSDQERMSMYLGAANPLRPGCMFTIEPGIYIPEKNLGVRIEDDVLVTETGCEVLTKDAPKEIADIEKLMAAQPVFVTGK
jgi:Xaa-Pro aminopeptidase